MIIGSCKIKLEIAWAESLKDKRSVVKSLVSKISSKFKVSIAEVEEQDNRNVAVLGIAYVSNDSRLIESVFEKIIKLIDQNSEAEILNIKEDKIFIE